MKIGCTSYSLRKEWGKEYEFSELESWTRIKEKFPEIEAWELLSDHLEKYLDDTEPEDLKKQREILNKAGFEWFGITCSSGVFVGIEEPHWVPDEQYRTNGFRRIKEFRRGFAEDWIEAAAELDIKMMRIDCIPFYMNHKIPYSDAFEFNVNLNIESYRDICKIAKEYDISIAIENHGGFASDLNVLRKLFAEVPDLKLVYDTGNLPDKNRFTMLEEFADRILYVHAKTHVFDENGNEKYIDYEKIINTLKDKGFDGILSIEWEGPGLTGNEGVRKSIDMLKKYI